MNAVEVKQGRTREERVCMAVAAVVALSAIIALVMNAAPSRSQQLGQADQPTTAQTSARKTSDGA